MCKDSQKSVICLTVTHPSNIWQIWIRWPSPGSICWKQTQVSDCLELFKDSSCSQQDHLHLVLIFVFFSLTHQAQPQGIITWWWLFSPAQGEQGAPIGHVLDQRMWDVEGLQLDVLMVGLTPLCHKRNIWRHQVWVRTLEETSKLPCEKVWSSIHGQVTYWEGLPGNLF